MQIIHETKTKTMVSMERGKNCNFTMEKPCKHHLHRMIRVNINSDKWNWWYVFLTWYIENGSSSVVFLLKTHNTSLIMRKIPEKGALLLSSPHLLRFLSHIQSNSTISDLDLPLLLSQTLFILLFLMYLMVCSLTEITLVKTTQVFLGILVTFNEFFQQIFTKHLQCTRHCTMWCGFTSERDR